MVKKKTYVFEALYSAKLLLCVFKPRKHGTSKKKKKEGVDNSGTWEEIMRTFTLVILKHTL